jgi:hypothetical protein
MWRIDRTRLLSQLPELRSGSSVAGEFVRVRNGVRIDPRETSIYLEVVTRCYFFRGAVATEPLLSCSLSIDCCLYGPLKSLPGFPFSPSGAESTTP